MMMASSVLLEGRNRALACERVGVPIATRIYDGPNTLTFVVSENVKRRHLAVGQRAFLALAVEERLVERAKERQVEHAGTAPGRPKRPEVDLLQVIGEHAGPLQRAPQARDFGGQSTGTSARSLRQAKRGRARAP